MSACVRNVKGLKIEHIDLNTNFFTIHETKETRDARQPKRIKPTIKIYHYNDDYSLKGADGVKDPKICPRLLPEHLHLSVL